MDSKIIVVVAIAVVALLVFLFNPFAKPQPVQQDDENLVDDVGPSPLDLLTPEELATHEEQLKNSDPVRYQALQEKNPGVCEAEQKQGDIEWCKAAVAEKLKDESICATITGFARDQCYGDVAEAKAAAELCSNVSDAYLKDDCYYRTAVLAGNINACYNVTDSDMGDNCVAEIAMDKNDAGICAKVREELFRQDCEYNITG